MEDTKSRVIGVLADALGVDDITMRDRFVADLGIRPGEEVNLLLELADEFGMDVPTSDASAWRTVGDAVHWFEAAEVSA